MVAISFSANEKFPEMILSGRKDQTIRPYNPKRFEQIKRIGKLQLYWKQRTKECYKIADAEVTEIFKIKFVIYYDSIGHKCITIYKLRENSYNEINAKELIELANRDGFDSVWDFIGWFEQQYKNLHDMDFMVIRWKLKRGN